MVGFGDWQFVTLRCLLELLVDLLQLFYVASQSVIFILHSGVLLLSFY
jgi:hypothetical protein